MGGESSDLPGQARVALCHRLFDAIEKADWRAVDGLMSPKATIWHCFDDQTSPFADFRGGFEVIASRALAFGYGERDYLAIPGGVFARHRLQATLPDGLKVDVPTAVRILVVDGRVTHLDEYLDTAKAEPLMALAMGGGADL